MSETKTQPDTRERILDAAERLFMESGYEGASMRMITGEAEVNLAAVNHHFGSKGSAAARSVPSSAGVAQPRATAGTGCPLNPAAAGEPLKPSAILEAFFGTC